MKKLIVRLKELEQEITQGESADLSSNAEIDQLLERRGISLPCTNLVNAFRVPKHLTLRGILDIERRFPHLTYD